LCQPQILGRCAKPAVAYDGSDNFNIAKAEHSCICNGGRALVKLFVKRPDPDKSKQAQVENDSFKKQSMVMPDQSRINHSRFYFSGCQHHQISFTSCMLCLANNALKI
jgi:hypothetical protein